MVLNRSALITEGSSQHVFKYYRNIRIGVLVSTISLRPSYRQTKKQGGSRAHDGVLGYLSQRLQDTLPVSRMTQLLHPRREGLA